jgi:hypothetical protein
MKLKLIVISLSLVCTPFTEAKKAPKDTFRLGDNSCTGFVSSCGSKVNTKIENKTQAKITRLKSIDSKNFLLEKVNQIRINRLEKNLGEAD